MRALLVVVGLATAALVAAGPAWAQVPSTIPTPTTAKPTTTSTTAAPTSTTAAPTSTTAASTTSTTKKATTTTKPANTTTQPSLTTIPTPAAQGTTTTTPPVTPQSGKISPAFIVLSAFGFAIALALLAVQWFLTRPGRTGWTF